MHQLSLFSPPRPIRIRHVLDPASEHLLRDFSSVRIAQGASRRAVLREVSQVRSLARECGASERPVALATLCHDISSIARGLREPRTAISRSTGRARLLAVQRFVTIIGPGLGCNPTADLATLDMFLPARPDSPWHSAGTAVAGLSERTRHRGPTLDASDLRRLVDAASRPEDGQRGVRDRALVALMCFSGLRAEEVVRLRWEDLETRLIPVGYFGLTARVARGERWLRLPVPEPAREALEALLSDVHRVVGTASGPVFSSIRRPALPLGYRAARNVLLRCCRRSELPPVESSDLRAACAYWLRAQGLSDHEVAAVLGIARVRTVDRLLRRHAALDAQRRVREIHD